MIMKISIARYPEVQLGRNTLTKKDTIKTTKHPKSKDALTHKNILEHYTYI